MKVLVLAQSRSGSTGFTAWLRDELGEPVMVEPFNISLHPKSEIDTQLDVIKSDNGIIVKFVDNMYKWLPEISDINVLMGYFDKVIGLTREDDRACTYSRIIGILSDNWKGAVANSAVNQNKLDEEMSRFDLYLNDTIKNKKMILDLPIFQITYEDLYVRKNIDRLLKYLEINEPKHLNYLFENKNITNNWNLVEFEYKYRNNK